MKKAKIFKNHILNSDRLSAIYNFINPILFDVTLRDGIQTMSVDEMPYERKINVFRNIVKYMEPKKMEIGSFVSPKILPIMNDTDKLYNECLQLVENMEPIEELKESGELINREVVVPDLYVLVPPSKTMVEKAKRMGVKNISVMSSVSEGFLKANTNMNMITTKKNMNLFRLEGNETGGRKLYLSCINECPIMGVMPNTLIVNEIKHYLSSFDEICLSDTCGSLTYRNYKEILDNYISLGLNTSKISLHLHVMDIMQVNNIIRYSLNKGIRKFDVSAFQGGGCSVTMKKGSINSNLTYDLFYEILINYMNDCKFPSPGPRGPNNKRRKRINKKNKFKIDKEYFDNFPRFNLNFA